MISYSHYSSYLKSRGRLGILYRRFWLYPRLYKLINGACLDVGCGIGDMLKFVPNSIGVDINPHNVAYCRDRGLQALEMSVDVLPFDTGVFDTVLLDNVIEHIADPRPLLSEVKRVLNQHGTLLIGVPGILGYSKDLDHKVFYDEVGLFNLASDNGFLVDRVLHMPLGRCHLLSKMLKQYCIYVQLSKCA